MIVQYSLYSKCSCYYSNTTFVCAYYIYFIFLPDCLCLKDAEKCILFFSFMAARRPGRCWPLRCEVWVFHPCLCGSQSKDMTARLIPQEKETTCIWSRYSDNPTFCFGSKPLHRCKTAWDADVKLNQEPVINQCGRLQWQEKRKTTMNG